MKKHNFNYPDETTGSKLAREVRERANSLSAKEREKHFKSGMAKIYAGTRPKR